MTDFPTTKAAFDSLFEGYRRTHKRAADGRHIMTPDVLGTFQIGEHVVEVSTGVFIDDRLFGVTVKARHDLCDSFDSIEAAEGYCSTLWRAERASA